MRDFQDLLQTTKIVAEIIAKCMERALLVLQYVVDEEMKKMHYHDMLKDKIREFISFRAAELWRI